MIISVHIRKCAGTSFRSALKDQFNNRLLLDYGDEIGSSHPSSVAKRQQSLKRLEQVAESITDDFDIVHGHFYRKKYDCLPGQHHYISFMRDPVERVLSNYYYLKRNKDRQNPDAIIVNQLGYSLMEFAAHPDNQNLQSQFLQTNSLNEFSFVGTVENYSVSIDKLNKMFDLRIAFDTQQNVNSNSSNQYEIDSKTLAHIRKYNQEDIRLYEIACEKF